VVYDKDIIDATDFAIAHGFGFIVPDFMIPRFWPERFNLEERNKIRRYLDDRGISISYHAPSDNIYLGVAYPEVRKAVHTRMKLCLDLCQDLEARATHILTLDEWSER
jgi:sugar phosphate isomerase/epimerase